jgi:hypothetical protein
MRANVRAIRGLDENIIKHISDDTIGDLANKKVFTHAFGIVSLADSLGDGIAAAAATTVLA